MARVRLRTFLCIKDYKIRPIYKGQILEICGGHFQMKGYMVSYIKNYEQLHYGLSAGMWRETTNELKL